MPLISNPKMVSGIFVSKEFYKLEAFPSIHMISVTFIFNKYDILDKDVKLDDSKRFMVSSSHGILLRLEQQHLTAFKVNGNCEEILKAWPIEYLVSCRNEVASEIQRFINL